MMQVTIVQEVEVVSVLNGGMPTVGAVNMGMVVVWLIHFLFQLVDTLKQMVRNRLRVWLLAVSKSVGDQLGNVPVCKSVKNVFALPPRGNDTFRSQKL